MYPFWTWAIINLLVGVWEVYTFKERSNLVLENQTIWSKMIKGEVTIKSFWLDAWSEYTKVDSRYIKEYSPSEYVWAFELLNATLAVLFIVSLIMKKLKWIKWILGLQILNCFLYFLSLGIEAGTNSTILNNMKTFASVWMFPVYYLICAIWLIVPIILYLL
jgi:hypothetical protein